MSLARNTCQTFYIRYMHRVINALLQPAATMPPQRRVRPDAALQCFVVEGSAFESIHAPTFVTEAFKFSVSTKKSQIMPRLVLATSYLVLHF
jgi:hypothetical protein